LTALVLDGNVWEAGETTALTTKQFTLSGPQPDGFTEAAARTLAAVLESGPLPLAVQISSTRTVAVSPSQASSSQ